MVDGYWSLVSIQRPITENNYTLAMPYAWIVKPGMKVDLGDLDPGHHAGLDEEKAAARLAKLAKEIDELQELMFAVRKTGLLIVFQARDTGGKDGAINRILRYTNVQSVAVASFKVPSEQELAHDFLWRVHAQTPPKGGIAIFNRSHYEDVIAVRVHKIVSKEVWKPRYEAINAFERLLTDSDTIVLKLYLHISKAEQKERLLAREADPTKAWKLNPGDWKERELWDATTEAYEDALTNCSTKSAPWRVVPANHKWFRDLAVAEAIRDVLKPHRREWERALEAIGAKARAELAAFREEA